MPKKLTHEKFLERLSQTNEHYINGELDIIGKYNGSDKPIECYCNVHNITLYPLPSNLWRNTGCIYCGGMYVLKGFNDMWTTRPDIAAMLQNPEDGYRYTCHSNQKSWFVCPDCSSLNFKKINNVTSFGLCCQHCSDGISYPNKFSRALLDQLPINTYDCEYQPEWAKPYYYDNHFWYNGVEYILEMDGYAHFRENSLFRYTLEQAQEKDRIKDELAIRHNICIIRVDCKRSEMEYVKSHILKSELNSIFDLSSIDWALCDKKAQISNVKKACDLYMSRDYSVAQIGKILHVSIPTVRRYLNNGTKYGICDYNIKSKKQ